MSSQHSSSLPAPAELLTLLPVVVAEVAEHAFFAMAEPCEERQFASLVAASEASRSRPAPAGWLCARVGFRGVVNGSPEVRLPVALARELGVALTRGGPPPGPTAHGTGGLAWPIAHTLCGA